MKNNSETMKRYSYLQDEYGLSTFYRLVKTYDTFNIVTSLGQVWAIYGCTRNDCIESERYVAIRNYTKDRLTASTIEKLIDSVCDFENR